MKSAKTGLFVIVLALIWPAYGGVVRPEEPEVQRGVIRPDDVDPYAGFESGYADDLYRSRDVHAIPRRIDAQPLVGTAVRERSYRETSSRVIYRPRGYVIEERPDRLTVESTTAQRVSSDSRVRVIRNPSQSYDYESRTIEETEREEQPYRLDRLDEQSYDQSRDTPFRYERRYYDDTPGTHLQPQPSARDRARAAVYSRGRLIEMYEGKIYRRQTASRVDDRLRQEEIAREPVRDEVAYRLGPSHYRSYQSDYDGRYRDGTRYRHYGFSRYPYDYRSGYDKYPWVRTSFRYRSSHILDSPHYGYHHGGLILYNRYNRYLNERRYGICNYGYRGYYGPRSGVTIYLGF